MADNRRAVRELIAAELANQANWSYGVQAMNVVRVLREAGYEIVHTTDEVTE